MREASGAGADQVAPPFEERATTMSLSAPLVPPSVSVECHAATQAEPSETTSGSQSAPLSVAALALSAAAADQVWPLSVEREKRMSVSAPIVPPSESGER